MTRSAALLAVAFFALGAPAQAAQQEWRHYLNARFGYAICIPTGLRESGPPPDNGDGRVFADGKGTELRVWGRWNGDNDSIAGTADAERGYLKDDGTNLTYAAKGGDWFVLSGRKGQRVVYERGRLSHGRFAIFTLSYPASAAARWNAAIPKITACFHDTTEGPLQ